MKKKNLMISLLVALIIVFVILNHKEIKVTKLNKMVNGSFQGSLSFPDYKGYIDDTLALNSMYSFEEAKDQGKIYLNVNKKVKSYDLFINSKKINTRKIKNGIYEIDISEISKNGTNTISVNNIKPNTKNAILVNIPYPKVIKGNIKEAGLREESFKLIDKIITSDIKNGFSSAQLAVIKDNKLVYSNSWGLKNSYNKQNKRIKNGAKVTNSTMYDLASNTKMYATVYAIEYLVDKEKINLDDKIIDILGKEFANDTIEIKYTSWKEKYPGLDKIKEWKSKLTIKDVLMHKAGFQDTGHYHNKFFDQENQKLDEKTKNVLYIENSNKKKTLKEGINKTPLIYKPGTNTMYSDIDYMILGLVVEKITKKDLDTFLKDTYLKPMNLKHITYSPLKNGFKQSDCAATEINGNTRNGLVNFPNVRKKTIKCEVHDEESYYMMEGVSGHAGLFASAEDLARLANVMLTGGYGNNKFFSKDVRDLFVSPQNLTDSNYGIGWWREADDKRVWYFGSQSPESTIGHQGWTGTLTMIDFENNIVIVYLTNSINTPIVNPTSLENANDFSGRYYTSSTLGFVPQVIYMGLDNNETNLTKELNSLIKNMQDEKQRLIEIKEKENGKKYDKNHPIIKANNSLKQID